MLLINTIIRPSTIEGAGRGVFVEEDFPVGMVFARYDPSVDHTVNWDDIKDDPEMLDKSYYEPDLGIYIFCSDNARFINHSCENYNYLTNEKGENYFVRDIKKGEELLANYCSWNEGEQEIVQEFLGKKACQCSWKGKTTVLSDAKLRNS